MTQAQLQLPGLEDSRFTVYDPFAEALYCRRSFAEACLVADNIGCSLVVEVPADAIIGPRAIRRFRKDGDQWRVETVASPSAAVLPFGPS
jgi:hypothetical protein